MAPNDAHGPLSASTAPANDKKNMTNDHDASNTTANTVTEPPQMTPPPHPTLIHALQANAASHPQQVLLQWANRQGRIVHQLNYDQLWRRAQAIAGILKGLDHPSNTNTNPQHPKYGPRVMLVYPPGLEFVEGMMGAMLAGMVPCTVYPPNLLTGKNTTKKNGNGNDSLQTLYHHAQDAGATYALTTTEYKRAVQLFELVHGSHSDNNNSISLTYIPTDTAQIRKHDINNNNWWSNLWGQSEKEEPSKQEPDDELTLPQPHDLAFIQYTSGSTGTPKGVMLSHAAVVHNLQTISDMCGSTTAKQTQMAVSWMPQYHDFGLLNFYLGPIFSAKLQAINFSPIDFIQHPLLWHKLLQQHKANLTAGPNFSYALLAKRLKAMEKNNNPNNNNSNHLPHMTGAYIGAEPIAPETLQVMVDVIGIPPDAVKPCYGMSESVVYITSIHGQEVDTITLSGRTLVASGLLQRNQRFGKTILLLDSKTKKVVHDDGVEGDIYVSGVDLAEGYWNKPELTQAAFGNMINGKAFLATGDMGVIQNGKLYVSGRSKEMIIINGRNLFPYDMERAIQTQFLDTRPGATVVFQHTNESVGVVLELRDHRSNNNKTTTVDAVRLLVEQWCPVSSLYILKRGAVPKTTSGKLRRGECQRLSMANEWDPTMVVASLQKDRCEATKSTETTTNSNRDNNSDKPRDVSSEFDDVLTSMLGQIDEAEKHLEWEQLGLSSIKAVELVDRLSARCMVNLPDDWVSSYPTPHALKSFVRESQNTRIETVQSELTVARSTRLSWRAFGILQAVGCTLVLLLFSFPIALSAYVGLRLLESKSYGGFMFPLLLFFVLSVWAVFFSLVVFATKWIVMGRYKEQVMEVPSLLYMRWWFVDRLVDLWEVWIGTHLKDSPLLNLFYASLGANIHHSVELSSFVREFDLVTINQGACVSSRPIRCRRFGAWAAENDEYATLRFRPIVIEEQCTVKGLVSLGATIGQGSFVESNSVIAEGGQVPKTSHCEGKPASIAGTTKYQATPQAATPYLLVVLKLLWMFITIYIAVGSYFIANVASRRYITDAMPYHNILAAGINIWLASLILFGVSVGLKWLLLGKRRPGAFTQTLCTALSEFVVDFLFSVAVVFPYLHFGNSRLFNFLFMAYGMDVDLRSKFFAYFFKPSKLDFIRMKNSFASTSAFSVERGGKYYKTELEETNIGWGASIGPGCKISKAAVSPLSHVTTSVTGGRTEAIKGSLPIIHLIGQETLNLFFIFFSLLSSFASIIPPYEVWHVLAPDDLSLVRIWPLLGLVLAVHTMTWLFLVRLQQLFVFLGSSRRDRPWNFSCYITFESTYRCCVQLFSLLRICFGGPVFNAYARFNGAHFEGRALFLETTSFYDAHFLHVADKTIADGAVVCGHFALFLELVLGPNRVSGTFHPFTWSGANSHAVNAETGPCVMVLPERGIMPKRTATFSEDEDDNVVDENTKLIQV